MTYQEYQDNRRYNAEKKTAQDHEAEEALEREIKRVLRGCDVAASLLKGRQARLKELEDRLAELKAKPKRTVRVRAQLKDERVMDLILDEVKNVTVNAASGNIYIDGEYQTSRREVESVHIYF